MKDTQENASTKIKSTEVKLTLMPTTKEWWSLEDFKETMLGPHRLLRGGGLLDSHNPWYTEHLMADDAHEFYMNRYSERRGLRPIPRPQFAFKDLMIH